jgi:pSer/pThr/pTyr-binding forkhead associated (FHA) protein
MDGTVMMEPKSSSPEAPLSRVLVGWLVTFSRLPNGQDFRLFEGRNLIGKDASESDIHLSDGAISRKHALILYRAGQYAIIDQDSTNGTWVNGVDVGIGGRSDLLDNDIVKVGDTVLVFKCFEAPKE